MPDTIHATCIALGSRAALLRGPSGAGKSDLALRCLALSDRPPRGQSVHLVADDRVVLSRRNGVIVASPPAVLAGRLEVRGVGIVAVPFLAEAAVALIVDLTAASAVERMPAELPSEDVLGVAIPVWALRPFEQSAPLKLIYAINTLGVAALP